MTDSRAALLLGGASPRDLAEQKAIRSHDDLVTALRVLVSAVEGMAAGSSAAFDHLRIASSNAKHVLARIDL